MIKKQILKTTSTSLYKLGFQRLEDHKTSSNVYEHFAEPTAELDSFSEDSCKTLKEFLEIHEVTLNYGRPETMDQMSGSMYLHAGVEEDKCSQCLRLADQMSSLSITDLSICLSKINWWSSEAGHSLALREILDKMDLACVDRLQSLHFPLKDQLRFCYQWQSLMFPYRAQFPCEMLKSLVATLHSPLAVPIIVSWLLLVSTDQPTLQDQRLLATELSRRLEVGLAILGEPELLACHAGLQCLAPGSEDQVREVLEKTYGYRL